MHRDSGKVDGFETLCDIPAMKVQRLRMRNTLKVENLKAPAGESVVIPLSGSVMVRSDDENQLTLGEKDVAYIRRGSSFSLEAPAQADVLWAYAPADNEYPSYVRR